MTETLANGYSSERTQWELFNEYHHDRILDDFQKTLRPSALDKSSLSIDKAKETNSNKQWKMLC